ncbi:MAG: YihY/virulence factor BrkB family protein [Agathobacter sp.]|nr:YihY/virulence factor BrkB family protein [Agathobacter sp.]
MMKKFTDNIKKLIASTDRDRVFLYAAQASYFVIVSVIPFICLLISAFSFFIPADIYTIFDVYKIPKELEGVVREVIEQLFATQKVSLLSISAIIALWTASRGMDSIRIGLERVYHERPSTDFFKQQFKSLASTIILIIVLLMNVVFSVFGAVIAEMFHLELLFDIIMYLSVPILFITMCTAFTIIYAFVGKIGKVRWRDRIVQHLPGAVFTTLGWMLFSYGFTLYIHFFPSASAIYGSLTAVCLLMLWVYVCVIILLLGAEINKLILRGKGILVKNEEVEIQEEKQ